MYLANKAAQNRNTNIEESAMFQAYRETNTCVLIIINTSLHSYSKLSLEAIGILLLLLLLVTAYESNISILEMSFIAY